jgi:hypothetical protein
MMRRLSHNLGDPTQSCDAIAAARPGREQPRELDLIKRDPRPQVVGG